VRGIQTGYARAPIAPWVRALAVLPFLGTSFLPEFNEGGLTVSVVTVPGTSLDEANSFGRRVEEILLADPSVENVDRRQGRAELDEHAQGVNAAELDVTLRPEIDKEETLARLREAFTVLPGTNVTLGQPISHRIDHMLSGTRAAIAVKIFGPDLRELRRLGARVRDAMGGVAGVADLQLEQQADVPQLRIYADRAALARFGMTPGDLGETIDVAFGGEPVSQVLEDGRAFDLVVRLPPELRSSHKATQVWPSTRPRAGACASRSWPASRSSAAPTSLLFRPSTMPAEIIPRASNQLRMSSRWLRTVRAIFFMGSMRDRITFVHQRFRNFPAHAGETYSQSSWNSSLSRYARMVLRLYWSRSVSFSLWREVRFSGFFSKGQRLFFRMGS